MTIIDRIRMVLVEPAKFFNYAKKEKGITRAFWYLASLSLFTSVAGLIVAYFTSSWVQLYISRLINIPLPVFDSKIFLIIVAILSYIVGLGLSFVGAGILHGWILLWGGKADYTKTYQLSVYSSTAYMVLGWLPVIGLLARIYDLYLLIIGTTKMHDLSLNRSIWMYLIPVVFFVIMCVIAVVMGFFALRLVNPTYLSI